MKTHPGLVQALYDAGKAKYEFGNLDLAIEDLREAIKTSKRQLETAEDHLLLAQIYRTLGAVYQTQYSLIWLNERDYGFGEVRYAGKSYRNAIECYTYSSLYLISARQEGLETETFQLESNVTSGFRAFLRYQEAERETDKKLRLTGCTVARAELLELQETLEESANPDYELGHLARVLRTLTFRQRRLFRKRADELTAPGTPLQYERSMIRATLFLGRRVLKCELKKVTLHTEPE